jgi:hypothetical protein
MYDINLAETWEIVKATSPLFLTVPIGSFT